MKFCQWTLFEAGRALFMKICSRKISWILNGKSHTLTHFVTFEEHMANKLKRYQLSVSQNLYLADGVVQLVILCIYMRRIN